MNFQAQLYQLSDLHFYRIKAKMVEEVSGEDFMETEVAKLWKMSMADTTKENVLTSLSPSL